MRTVWNQSTRSFILVESLWKTLSNVIKVLVRVGDEVRLRPGIQGWNVYYSRTFILLHFTHNPPRSITRRKVTLRVPQECRGM